MMLVASDILDIVVAELFALSGGSDRSLLLLFDLSVAGMPRPTTISPIVPPWVGDMTKVVVFSSAILSGLRAAATASFSSF